MTFLTAVWGMIQSVHVTFPTLWNWHFFPWMGLEIDTFWQSLDLGEVFPFSDDLWCLSASACSPGRLYCLDPEWKIVLRWNTFLGYLNFHSATFQRVGGWQRDAAMLEIWPHWNFQRELLPVLKTKISGHLRLRESSGVSLLACSVPFSSPILIFKKKKQAQAKGHFYLKPGEWGRNTRAEEWAVWWGVLLLVCFSPWRLWASAFPSPEDGTPLFSPGWGDPLLPRGKSTPTYSGVHFKHL